ncbi:MAG: hypothetical protein AAGA08_17590 [Pseudomonadota bacterium]
MSNTDSFIEEVTEEVQRDKLFALMKKWGWVAGLAVLLVVGGAAYNEWRKANERQIAQDFGDRLLAGLDSDDATALNEVTLGDPAQAAVAGHLAAAVALGSGETEAGLERLRALESNADVGPIYRELASFKAALALPDDTPAEEKIAAFETVTGTFRVLAQEQIAHVLAADGQTDAAVALLRSLVEAAGTPPGVQRRAAEVIVALGRDLTDEG